MKKQMFIAIAVAIFGVLEFSEIRLFYLIKKYGGVRRKNDTHGRIITYVFPDESELHLTPDKGLWKMCTLSGEGTKAYECTSRILMRDTPTNQFDF